ncbi:DUF3046 domain-containing protein [Nocardioides stalactiti]|uniref:DUF3046 domain-containing protein n=1 Tax=Nocardioides stalactiti TaxID=2755356 RepID=UPI001601DBED|nr:DUF3046 domain-containing protein [Nocardioides stalactiti]
MRHTEFWARLDHQLGEAYSRTWAETQVLGVLGHRTPQQALDAGVPPKQVWAAVWQSLELPVSEK